MATVRSTGGSPRRAHLACKRCGFAKSQQVFESRGLFGVYDENHPDEFREGNYPMVLIHCGEPVAVIRIDIEGKWAIFRRVAVGEDMQHRGHGKVMLSLAEGFAREKETEAIRSFVNPEAVFFYERCGFTRDESMAADLKHVPMTKALA
jgi:N-acetylglutamate synthase-like GNAT family acetyltransferase